MKTAISIPDPVYEAGEQLAERLGMSRSELYTTALSAYIDMQDSQRITERLNEVCETEDTSIDPVIFRLEMLSLPREEW